MDLLIHAIIWLFKALFGDSEEQARVGPRRDSDSEGGTRRGPYDYGDGRSSGSSGGTKTLAELLEEARRQSSGQAPRPAAPPQPPSAAPGAPRGTRSLADLLEETRRQGGPAQAPAQPPAARAPVPPPPPRPAPASTIVPIAPVTAVVPVARPAPAYSVPPPPQPQAQPQQQQPSRKKKRKRRDDARPAPAPAAQPMPAGMHGMHGMHGMQVMRSAKTHRGVHIGAVGREVGQFVAALRVAKASEKRTAGARAVAMLEVFGAPRCKRPHRPGARLF